MNSKNMLDKILSSPPDTLQGVDSAISSVSAQALVEISQHLENMIKTLKVLAAKRI